MSKEEHSIETMENRKPANINGVKNPMCKLTEKEVYEIADLLRSGKYNFTQIAKMYNVTASAITGIAYNRNWTHLNLDLHYVPEKVCSGLENEEFEAICKFFSSVDINDKTIYPSKNKLFKDCFIQLGLDKKYNLEDKRKTINKILLKSCKAHERVTSKYDYNYIK